MLLSAGHSNSDPGACAFGRTEAAIAAEFRNIVSFYLLRDNIKHATDGEAATNLPLSAAAALARQHRPAVEFHCNAGPASASGVEALCNMSRDKVLAESICQVISSTLSIKNRGAKPENSGQHSRLAFVQAGGIIVELFFITNKNDLAAYDARKWLAGREVARVLAGV
jgi:N-acetylmuramoyl-L-alanine amidase